MNQNMRTILLTILTVFSFFTQAQNPLKIVTGFPPTLANIKLGYDNFFVYTSNGSSKVIKLDANYQIAWELIPKTGKTSYIFKQSPHNNGLYVVGEQALSNNGVNLERYPFIIAYDTCLNPLWHKIFVYTDQYDDTTIQLIDDVPDFREIWTDELSNLYILTTKEDRLAYIDSIGMIYNTNYISKYNTDGKLIFRKRLIDVFHGSPYLRLSHSRLEDKKIIYGGAFYIPEHGGQIVFNRPTICILDTAGNCVKFRYYNSYHYFAGNLIDFKFVPEDSTFIGVLSGIGYDTILRKEYSESHIVKYDYELNEIKRISSTERDSAFYDHSCFEFDSIGNIVIHVNKTFVHEDPHWDKRRRHPYFAKYDKDLNFIDSIPITYMNYKSGFDSLFGFHTMHKNPQNPNSIIISGTRRYGTSTIHKLLLRINSIDMQPDSTVYPTLPNDTLCSKTLSGTITHTTILTDTVVINKRVNRKYNQWSGTKELVPENKITLSPNPATTHTHITSPVKIESYTINNTSGTQLQSGVLENNNNIDISQLPQGLYFLQLQLVNGQRVVKKLVVNKE
jgi:hypothetical protein